MLTSPHISLSFAPFPSLSLSSSLALCVFFWNRPSVMSTEISRHSAGASAGLTFPLPVIYIRGRSRRRRTGSWGIFHASQGRWRWVEGVVCVRVGRRVYRTLGLDTVRDSNNGGRDHPAERCFYCKENLHECIQASTP